MKITPDTKGVAAAVLSSALGGTAVVATRAAVGPLGGGALDPLSLAFARYMIGALALMCFLGWVGLARPQRRDLLPIVLLGVLFFALFPLLFNLSLAYTSAPRGSLALSTLPLLTLALAATLGIEPMTLRKLAGVLLAMAGVGSALVGDLAAGPEGAWRGDLVMVATAAVGAIFNVFSRPYLARYRAIAFVAYAMLAGSLFLGLALPLSGLLGVVTASPGALDPGDWALVAYLGLFGAALTFFLWGYGLEHTTPTKVAVTVAVNPMTSMLLAALFLNEQVTAGLLTGLAAVALGIFITMRPSGERTRRPKAGGRDLPP
ncbi:DMT family transporter [Pelagibius litoralis]|uniref:DMT family transporter n=1 Tax=Pelagibius litoralis TaxID=374515 RepID=A0A967F2F2_9PROT|nr:DMT family transporter [Pelagibius litoralis]NIA71904.1 DMT family transporter [Pelagibius litoralis]